MEEKEIYQLSTDYTRLFELIKTGMKIVCFVDYDTTFGSSLRDICVARMGDDGRFAFSVRGMEYNGWYSRKPVTFEGFKEACEKSNIEFIDPAREVRLVEALEWYANPDRHIFVDEVSGRTILDRREDADRAINALNCKE